MALIAAHNMALRNVFPQDQEMRIRSRCARAFAILCGVDEHAVARRMEYYQQMFTENFPVYPQAIFGNILAGRLGLDGNSPLVQSVVGLTLFEGMLAVPGWSVLKRELDIVSGT